MQITVEIPDDFVRKTVEDAVRRWNGEWRKLLEDRAQGLIRKELIPEAVVRRVEEGE